MNQKVLTKHGVHWQHDSRLHSLQNCEKLMFAVYKPANLWYFGTAAQMD